MRFQTLIEQKQDELLSSLQKCIQFPSLYQSDDSGYPYGKPIQECLEYMLQLSESLGFRTYNMDNQVGWAE
ncbi:MAG: dipeptidase PepV, partial [Clostridia bacterium]|nr:dipeptidase PepV [Clostridia bacterium]